MQDPKVNILIYPMMSVDVVNADSCYVLIKYIVNGILRQTNRFSFILLLPNNREYVRDDLDQRVKKVFMPMPTSKRGQVADFQFNLLAQVVKEYPVELVWNCVVEQAHNWAHLVDTIDPAWRLRVFNQHLYVIHPSLDPAIYRSLANVRAAQVMGASLAHMNYFLSSYAHEMFMEEVAKTQNQESIDAIKSTCRVDLAGFIDPQLIEASRRDPFPTYTFAYNHRLDGYKNFDATFEMFDKLHAEGLPFNVLITAGDRKNHNKINERFPYANCRSFTLHSEYMENLSRCAANTLNSNHETYCIALAESIMFGQPVAAPNRVTFPELLGADYPFLFTSEREQMQICRKFIQEDMRRFDYPKATHDRLAVQRSVDIHLDCFTQLAERKSIIKTMRNRKLLDKLLTALEGMSELSMKEARNMLNRVRLGPQAFPSIKLHRLLCEAGFEFNTFEKKYQRSS